MKVLAALMAVGAAAAATSASAAAPGIARGDGIVVSYKNVIYVDGTRIARGSQPTWSPDGKRVAFLRFSQLFVIDANGKDERRLTRNKPSMYWPASSPAWAPDGRRIAFGGVFDIFTVDVATKKITKLTNSQHSWQGHHTPAYSPDGKTIAFSRSTDAFNNDIFLMSANGKNLRRLTKTDGTYDQLGEETMPDWSPDGRTIAFVSNRDGNFELYRINRNGTNERQLTRTSSVNEEAPRVSPDGSRILYVHDGLVAHMKLHGTDVRELGSGSAADWRSAATPTDRLVISQKGKISVAGRTIARGNEPTVSDDGTMLAYIGLDGDLRVTGIDGKNVERLTRTAPFEISPAWSPDGKNVAYASTAGGIYVISAKGGTSRRLTPKTPHFTPAFSPDGKRIAFSRSTDEFNSDIYVMNADGTHVRRLTETRGTHDTYGEEAAPEYSPDGKRIVFQTNRDGNIELYVMNADGSNEGG